VLLGTPLGNTLGIWREDVGNKGKMKKKTLPLPPTPSQNPKLKRQKKQGTLYALWAFPLSAWNFYFQNRSPPFLGWANTPIINWEYLFYSPFLFVRWDASQVFFCLFWGQQANLVGPPLTKKMKLWRLHKIEGPLYFEVYRASPVAHLCKWKKDNICQSIWDKMRCNGEHVGEHIENLGNRPAPKGLP
jgi:hypothetical protein